VEKCCRAGQTTDADAVRHMRFACWITKATDPRSGYVIPIAFPQRQWFRERASVLHLNVYCLPCGILKFGGTLGLIITQRQRKVRSVPEPFEMGLGLMPI
jgi:hypothetical protein